MTALQVRSATRTDSHLARLGGHSDPLISTARSLPGRLRGAVQMRGSFWSPNWSNGSDTLIQQMGYLDGPPGLLRGGTRQREGRWSHPALGLSGVILGGLVLLAATSCSRRASESSSAAIPSVTDGRSGIPSPRDRPPAAQEGAKQPLLLPNGLPSVGNPIPYKRRRIPTPNARPLPNPKREAFSCTSNLAQRTQCAKLGADCALEAAPGYWLWPAGPEQGARLTAEARERAWKEVNARPIPSCMCTCDAEYERLDAANSQRGVPPS